jgi:hypothetical protein
VGCLSIAPTTAAAISIAISGDAWPDDARLSDIEERFTCRVCGKRGADVRSDFNWDRNVVVALKAVSLSG